MLKQRLILGTLMIALLLGLIFLDAWMSSGTASAGAPWRLWGLPIVAIATLLIALAALEMGTLLGQSGFAPVRLWAVFVCAGLVVTPWAVNAWGTGIQSFTETQRPVTVVWLMGGLLGTALAILARRRTERAVADMAGTVLIILYLGLLGSFFVRIRCLIPGPAGAILLLYALLSIKACDIGAYLVGRKIGRHPLAPWLSPGKTIEGFIGGLALACAVAVGGMAWWAAQGGNLLGPAPLNIAQALAFGALMAISGHLGDLTESAIKRDIGVKDSGSGIAAFGGLLDLIDSPLFGAPIAWWCLTIFGRLG